MKAGDRRPASSKPSPGRSEPALKMVHLNPATLVTPNRSMPSANLSHDHQAPDGEGNDDETQDRDT